MNEDTNEIEIERKIKKVAITLGTIAMTVAIVAIAFTTGNGQKNNVITVTTTKKSEEAVTVAPTETTKIPAVTQSATMVVPATEITVMATEASSEAAAAVVVDYMLPMGGELSGDISIDIPVYNSIMNDWRTHNGVDFAGEYGDCVKSAAKGIVREVSYSAIMGDTVKVEHEDGVLAVYCGVTVGDDIKKGVIVERGQMLGTLSEVPCERDADIPHLHFETHKDGKIIDPLEVLGYYE